MMKLSPEKRNSKEKSQRQQNILELLATTSAAATVAREQVRLSFCSIRERKSIMRSSGNIQVDLREEDF